MGEKRGRQRNNKGESSPVDYESRTLGCSSVSLPTSSTSITTSIHVHDGLRWHGGETDGKKKRRRGRGERVGESEDEPDGVGLNPWFLSCFAKGAFALGGFLLAMSWEEEVQYRQPHRKGKRMPSGVLTVVVL
ncbi:hypothetical protein L249_1197 [Ophiocordyceps polyrhachis-furcata BCC 54312]|uniref:Uncharacterized protein n=1 Tax=Ophiocordyceps polyrhachis-furcata BCC 54312 TaxID=1330021 RepID=A0A367LFR1_9HYPO|nr:hypothetical protein L249_1197 [Ophiocordyceps polyrhachis-furcata BCC 54312]